MIFARSRRSQDPAYDVGADLRRLESAIRDYQQLDVLQDAGVYDVADRLCWNLHTMRSFTVYRRPSKAQASEFALAAQQSAADRPVVFSVLDDMPARLAARRALREEALQEKKRTAALRESEQRRHAADTAKERESQERSREHLKRASSYQTARRERQHLLEQTPLCKPPQEASRADETAHLGSRAWEEAERLAARYLQEHGYDDAHVTPPGNDKGLDVVGRAVTAQVKYLSKPVGAPMLQQTVGASGGREVSFFSRSGYTAAAVEYATAEEVALFTVELPGAVQPVNRRARLIANQ